MHLSAIRSLLCYYKPRVLLQRGGEEGETEKFGKYKCQEYQEVFLLWWRGYDIIETTSFAPLVQEEVSGFEIMNANELIQRLRQGDDELVPRSTDYVNALAKVFGCGE